MYYKWYETKKKKKNRCTCFAPWTGHRFSAVCQNIERNGYSWNFNSFLLHDGTDWKRDGFQNTGASCEFGPGFFSPYGTHCFVYAFFIIIGIWCGCVFEHKIIKRADCIYGNSFYAHSFVNVTVVHACEFDRLFLS